MTFQEIRIIATGACIANQLRDVNTICRRSWYIAAHVWKISKLDIYGFIAKTDVNLKTNGSLSRPNYHRAPEFMKSNAFFTISPRGVHPRSNQWCGTDMVLLDIFITEIYS